MYQVYIIAHLYGSESFNHEKVNFRLFNAYKTYQVIKVQDGDSNINWCKTVKDWVAAINWTQFKIYFKYMKKCAFYVYKSSILVSALSQKRKRDSHSSMSPVERSTIRGPQKNAYTCANHMHSTWLEIDGARK